MNINGLSRVLVRASKDSSSQKLYINEETRTPRVSGSGLFDRLRNRFSGYKLFESDESFSKISKIVTKTLNTNKERLNQEDLEELLVNYQKFKDRVSKTKNNDKKKRIQACFIGVRKNLAYYVQREKLINYRPNDSDPHFLKNEDEELARLSPDEFETILQDFLPQRMKQRAENLDHWNKSLRAKIERGYPLCAIEDVYCIESFLDLGASEFEVAVLSEAKSRQMQEQKRILKDLRFQNRHLIYFGVNALGALPPEEFQTKLGDLQREIAEKKKQIAEQGEENRKLWDESLKTRIEERYPLAASLQIDPLLPLKTSEFEAAVLKEAILLEKRVVEQRRQKWNGLVEQYSSAARVNFDQYIRLLKEQVIQFANHLSGDPEIPNRQFFEKLSKKYPQLIKEIDVERFIKLEHEEFRNKINELLKVKTSEEYNQFFKQILHLKERSEEEVIQIMDDNEQRYKQLTERENSDPLKALSFFLTEIDSRFLFSFISAEDWKNLCFEIQKNPSVAWVQKIVGEIQILQQAAAYSPTREGQIPLNSKARKALLPLAKAIHFEEVHQMRDELAMVRTDKARGNNSSLELLQIEIRNLESQKENILPDHVKRLKKRKATVERLKSDESFLASYARELADYEKEFEKFSNAARSFVDASKRTGRGAKKVLPPIAE